ncbi:hypothetical protein GOP47_0023461 [Adiantum capillus-veneris]|uniref:Uncharacterized protein n=1 Tax=Adiantum capillus-veneris TaxID=13818 RepID=A0A9D4Z5X7_ADICA|nr:hypothetical protein GOP47_0023461 [Adiantum capillus-veneris]
MCTGSKKKLDRTCVRFLLLAPNERKRSVDSADNTVFYPRFHNSCTFKRQRSTHEQALALSSSLGGSSSTSRLRSLSLCMRDKL